METVKEQASVVSQLLFSAETGNIYKKALTRSWNILREIGVLLWLIICLTFVGGEWFYRTAVGLGRSTRAWYVGLSEKSPSAEPQSMTSTGEALLSSVKSGTAYLLGQARQQLGMPKPETTPATPPTVATTTAAGPPAPVPSTSVSSPPTAIVTPSSIAPAAEPPVEDANDLT
ncbi:MAG: hypothetical protein WBB18_05675 [Nodosilinea sp.]